MKTTAMNHLQLQQVHARLSAFSPLVHLRRPSKGWLRLIRETIGRTQRQQAQRLGVTGATVHKAEVSESDEPITVGQLRKLADGLDCELVYALVPRTPLLEVVQNRARAIATREVERVAHSMRLEDQHPGEGQVSPQLERRTEDLLRANWSALWR